MASSEPRKDWPCFMRYQVSECSYWRIEIRVPALGPSEESESTKYKKWMVSVCLSYRAT